MNLKTSTTIILLSIILGILTVRFVPNVIAMITFYGGAALIWFFLSNVPPKPAVGWEARRGELAVVLSLVFCVVVALVSL